MEKYKGKYTSKSRRLKGWDYGENGYYFITICTLNKECVFGSIINDNIHLTDDGKIADKYLSEMDQRYSFVKVDNFVVMPNHLHIILIMNVDAINRASTRVLDNSGGFAGIRNPMINNNISRVVRWYKGRVSYEIRKMNSGFSWQANYHDHIIRNEKSYREIYDYVTNNPLKWSLDKLNPLND